MSGLIDQAVELLRQAASELRDDASRVDAAIAVLDRQDDPPPDPPDPTPARPTIDLTALEQTERKPADKLGAPGVREAGKKRPAVPKPGTIDFAEVARIASEAQADGRSMRDAVATHYSITTHNADQRIATARKKGHDIPPASTGARPSSVGPVDVRAGVIPEGHASIGATAEVVEQQPARPATPQIPGKHFECNDCVDRDFATTRELIHHTIARHERQPHPEERMPVTNEAGS